MKTAEEILNSHYYHRGDPEIDFDSLVNLVIEVRAEAKEIRNKEITTCGDSWKNYIKQFDKLNEFWISIPEATNTWLSQQIDIFAGKYPPIKEVKEDQLEHNEKSFKDNPVNYLLVNALRFLTLEQRICLRDNLTERIPKPIVKEDHSADDSLIKKMNKVFADSKENDYKGLPHAHSIAQQCAQSAQSHTNDELRKVIDWIDANTFIIDDV
jgi:hypothetical protein